jgi:fatty acid kinase fatty acid binding subunit
VPNVRVITDSGCDIPEETASALGIDIVSLSIRFGDEELTDRVELSPAEFWRRCKASKVLPETAAPSAGAFQSAYQRASDAGCDGVLVLTLSAALSATHQAAALAADTVGGTIDVRVIDTKAVTMAQGFIAIEAAELARGGAGLDELVAHVEGLMTRVGICGMLDTLEHLVKGGRVGGARALLGQVLSIKPLLELKDGVVAEAGRQRTRARGLAAIAQVARSHAPLRRLAVVHGDAHDLDGFVASLREIPVEFPLVLTDMGPVVGTHGGPGIVALCWVEA